MSPRLPTCQLGKNGPPVTALGFGAMGLSWLGAYRQRTATLYGAAPSDEERFKVLDRVYDLGCKFWDTAGKPLNSTAII
ncbi:hypothetical protein OEA41_006163 [Lepraria neglecta]|uniref:Aldo/keto reductase n=1 Tax=Lepraria neglecta TaxID=209136 RepID=A0AAD9ZB29_9LECA|nr:hypothetical protein OEA41_006163 [Lepraria neglecta]